MNRKHLLLGGIAASFVLVGCQPSTQDGGTGATPSGMPADTMMSDTTTRDTVALTPTPDHHARLHIAE